MKYCKEQIIELFDYGMTTSLTVYHPEEIQMFGQRFQLAIGKTITPVIPNDIYISSSFPACFGIQEEPAKHPI